MHTHVVSGDRITKSRTLWHEQADGSVLLEAQQDVGDIVDENRRLFNAVDSRAPFKGDLVRVASIPNVIFWELKRNGIIDDEKALKAWLNHPDNRYFRTRPGKI